MSVETKCKYCDVKNLSCFSRINSDDLDYLNSIKKSNLYKKGQDVFYEGMRPTGVYCLYSGKIKIFKLGIDGKEQIVRFATPGNLLGIRAIISGREYSASASTLEDSVVCFIDRRTFLKLTVKYPYLSHCLMITLTKLLEEAENKLTSLAQKGVRERLAETLIVLSNVFEYENSTNSMPVISLTRLDLSNIVGTATETVIRLLSEFKHEGLIEIKGRKITLIDIKGLQRTGKILI